MKFVFVACALSSVMILSACGSSKTTEPVISNVSTSNDLAYVATNDKNAKRAIEKPAQPNSSASVSTSPKTEISVPVSTDESYSTAASKAQAHCAQWNVEAGAPFKGTNANGQAVLTYKCL